MSTVSVLLVRPYFTFWCLWEFFPRESCGRSSEEARSCFPRAYWPIVHAWAKMCSQYAWARPFTFLLFPLKIQSAAVGLILIFSYSLTLRLSLLSSRVYRLLPFPHHFTSHYLEHFFDIEKSHGCDTLSYYMEFLLLAFVHVWFPWFSFNWTDTFVSRCGPLGMLPL